jgi:predicted nucleic acid-binding protein
VKASIDTNIFVYGADPRNPAKQHAAREVIRRTASALGTVAEQCLFEFLSVATRRLYVPLPLAIGITQQWALILEVIVPPTDIFDLAVSTMNKYDVSVWDGRLLATCDANRASVLFTEDLQDGGRYGSVTVINPFNPANHAHIDSILPP